MSGLSRNNWGDIRKKGKIKYIWKRGILTYGFPVGILIVFFQMSMDMGFTNIFNLGNIIGGLVAGLLNGFMIGVLYGLIMWAYYEWKWRKGN
ncbi:hypothetical protein [Chengkuizengella axinellae]|uniref:Uncharacterized protein n=1 Tax=Chengkuizengella axinellae TaxID=3064388 RepID=A0ABT9J1H5_9BACL|nr:hypothetical protein [Chengkuizengella sp. 2205SS18-9]MDP5275435.1 hypothetical protein [Chengkuizengella sp. 2205SS18-9]